MALLAVLGTGLVGCQGKAAISKEVPRPLHLLLPRGLRFHFFTKTNRTFDDAGGIRGMEVYLQTRDAFDDSNKAFGQFRIEMYTHQPRSEDPKGSQVAVWTVDLADPMDNLKHWDSNARAYRFKLEWKRGVPVGQKFVLVAVYTSPFRKDRLTAEQVFISGE
jgi:hypothetical protein